MSQDDKLASISNYILQKLAIYNILLLKGLKEYIEIIQIKLKEIIKIEKDNKGKDIITTINILDIKAQTKNNTKAIVTI